MPPSVPALRGLLLLSESDCTREFARRKAKSQKTFNLQLAGSLYAATHPNICDAWQIPREYREGWTVAARSATMPTEQNAREGPAGVRNLYGEATHD